MAALLFYQTPTLLDKHVHKDLKFKKINDFDFASEVNSVPVAAQEFFQCGRNHPILFSKNEREEYIPIALLSLLNKGHHLGKDWGDVYVPSFIQRYPFALEEKQGMVMIDKDAPHFQQNDGERLLSDAGEPSETLNKILQMLQTLDRAYALTKDFTKAVADKGLFKPCKHTIKFSDREIKFGHLYAIEESEFNKALSSEEIVTWFKNGWIAWSYAHINSISAMTELVKRMPH